MLMSQLVNFFLYLIDIGKGIITEIVTVVLTTQILSYIDKKKKNHSADQSKKDGSSSD